MQVINTGRVPIKIWSDIATVEAEAIQQLQNIAALPFVFRHVAVMPDVHLGKGATVGSVIASKGAISPAAVGVDIGCFVGETRIPLLDGTQAPLMDLCERSDPFWVYSLDSSRNIVPGKARAVKTRENSELMRVVVSGGDEIVCTPDHEFMLNDGSYRQAKDLKFNDSLMPLYRRWQTRDGYESVSTGKGSMRLTHKLVCESLGGPVAAGMVVHHKNHIHFDNRPENLVVMDAADHSAYHRKAGNSFDNGNPAFQEKRLAGVAARSKDPAKREKMVETGIKNITVYMKESPEHFRAAASGNGKRGAKYLEKFNTSPRSCGECGEVPKNPSALRWHKSKVHGHNHKVILTEHLNRRADVYCLQVEDHNNFALAAGVFVHNCGMLAAPIGCNIDDLGNLAELRAKIENAVPVGFKGHELGQVIAHADSASERVRSVWQRAALQMGTLGGGNHFIEICDGGNGEAWLMLHSGSRNVGKSVAEVHIKKAKRLMEIWQISLADPDLAYLAQGVPEFDEYIEDLHWCQDYAMQNRLHMLHAIFRVLGRTMPLPEQVVNCHHNYVAQENHFGQNVFVTRKGAVRARIGDAGIIPGSMGQRSYIVQGLGNAESFCSCSHGAGRKHSRTKAKALFTVEDLAAQTMGVECRKDEGVLDEIPSAYKSIDVVMENQKDLVSIQRELKAVLCVKG